MPERDPSNTPIRKSVNSVSSPWGILVIFLGLIVIATLSNIGSFSFVLYGLCGILLISWIWMSSVVRNLSIQRNYDDHAHFGERVPVHIDVHNRGLFPFLWLRINEHLPLELSAPNFFHAVLSLAPRDHVRFQYLLTCKKRGYYNIGPLEFQSGGFWGLFEGRKYHLPPQRMIVYPRIIRISDLNLPSQKSAGALQSPQRLSEDPSRIFGVRPYISGDNIRKIDWKTTAATNQLYVKRFQSSIALDAHLFLNLSQQDYVGRGLFTATEMGITIAASLAAYLTQKRQAVGLTVLALDVMAERDDFISIPSGKGDVHLMQLLELLARVSRSHSEKAFDHFLPLMTTNLTWGTIAFVITPISSEKLFEVFIGLQKRGVQPVLILTQTGAGFQNAAAKAKEMGIPCFRMEQDRDLDIWRGSVFPIDRFHHLTGQGK
jgi:uncharacterized protein (DUF58 family)